jgi:hypothetical protein
LPLDRGLKGEEFEGAIGDVSLLGDRLDGDSPCSDSSLTGAWDVDFLSTELRLGDLRWLESLCFGASVATFSLEGIRGLIEANCVRFGSCRLISRGLLSALSSSLRSGRGRLLKYLIHRSRHDWYECRLFWSLSACFQILQV